VKHSSFRWCCAGDWALDEVEETVEFRRRRWQ
jgi:hypothetical protein